MTRWIAFDEESTAATADRTQTAVLFQRGNALVAALSSRNSALILLPGGTPDEALLLAVHRTPASTTGISPVRFEPAGFLGLHDEPVYADEPAPKKKWWQRLLD